MSIDIHPHFDGATNTVSYVVADRATRRAAIIDPVLDFDPRAAQLATDSADALLGIVEKEGLTVDWILETHAHADHLTAAHYLRRKTGAKVAIGKHITEVQQIFLPIFEIEDTRPDGAVFDRLVADGDTLPLGDNEIKVLHTPGHTPADVTYLIGDAARRARAVCLGNDRRGRKSGQRPCPRGHQRGRFRRHARETRRDAFGADADPARAAGQCSRGFAAARERRRACISATSDQ
ncbi:MAG: MBL fold metallo-hydrolase [Sphingomonadales bacterium]|nr:MBL fold metallo-hydrolase [Sphingomonadales bacterium]